MRRLSGLLLTVVCATAFAQDEWAAPPQSSPPPAEAAPLPPPPPPPPPEQPRVAPTPTPRPIPADVPREDRSVGFGFRFAPALTLQILGIGFKGGAIGVPSLRTGLRFALLSRKDDDYTLNWSLSVEAGLEGENTLTRGAIYGFGLTVRGGPAFVTGGGLFFPFFDAYGLVTLAYLNAGYAALITAHLGLGVHFNAFAIHSGSWWGGAGGSSGDLFVLALVIPSVELVWSPPNALTPGGGVAEVRLGVGF